MMNCQHPYLKNQARNAILCIYISYETQVGRQFYIFEGLSGIVVLSLGKTSL